MSGTGYIKLYRKMTDWEWYNDIPTKTLFLHLLLTANHAPNKWRGIEIGTGQRVTSLSHLAEETGLSVRQVRTALSHLKKTKEIDTQVTHSYTLVTIANYGDYQSSCREATREVTHHRQSIDKASTTNKNDKNDKNEKNIREAFVKPSLQEVEDYIREKNYNVDSEQFIAYYESNGWKVGRNKMKSWKSALTTWERRSNATRRTDKDADSRARDYDRAIFG